MWVCVSCQSYGKGKRGLGNGRMSVISMCVPGNGGIVRRPGGPKKGGGAYLDSWVVSVVDIGHALLRGVMERGEGEG